MVMQKAVLINIVLVVMLISGCAKEKSPEDIVQAYISAQNSHNVGCQRNIMRFAPVPQHIDKRQKTPAVKLFYDAGVAAFSFSSGKRSLYQMAVHS